MNVPASCRHCDPNEYAYVLALYLGDGWIYRNWKNYTLALALDTAYPGIIRSARAAVESLSGQRSWTSKRAGKNCLYIGTTWREWPTVIPQHGPGRKHHREISLARWQRRIVESDPRPFLRGLIETDGWRGLNRVFVKGRWYEYPRYQFSNRSDEIRALFTDACDLMGLEWRPWTRWHISVARRDSVAILDSFIGPKR